MTPAPLSQPRLRASGTLRAVLFWLVVGFAAPALAEPPPEVSQLIRQGQYPQALEKVDAYLAGTPNDAQALFFKGVIYSGMNKPDEAIAVFTRLTEDYPEFPEPYNNLAVLYAQQKLYEKARMALEMAIRAHPSYAIAYENLGDLYARMAGQAYEKAAQLDAGNKTAGRKLLLARDLLVPPAKTSEKPPAAQASPTSKADKK